MIGATELAAYAIALGVAAAIPGPGMTALVARSVGNGAVAGFAMLFGLIIGDLCYLSFAVFGLAVVAKNFAALFNRHSMVFNPLPAVSRLAVLDG